jgi:hypothetical protein
MYPFIDPAIHSFVHTCAHASLSIIAGSRIRFRQLKSDLAATLLTLLASLIADGTMAAGPTFLSELSVTQRKAEQILLCVLPTWIHWASWACAKALPVAGGC